MTQSYNNLVEDKSLGAVVNSTATCFGANLDAALASMFGNSIPFLFVNLIL